MNKSKVLGLIAIIIVVTIYGVSYISRDVIDDYMHATVIVGFQLTIMAVLFTIYNVVKKYNFKIEKSDIFIICLSGLFGTTFFHVLTVLSITAIGPTVSSLLFGFAAVFSLLIDTIFFKRPKTKLSIVSVIVSLIGVYILMGIDFNDLASTNFKGYSLTLLSIISWVVYCFLSDKVSDKYDKTVMLNYQAAVGAVTTLPFIFVYPVSMGHLMMGKVIINLIILGVFNSTIAYFLNIYAIKNIGVTLSNLFMNFLPVITIILSLLLYGTIPSMNQVVGGIIIITSVLLLNKDQNNIERIEELNN
ncbi:DMT family transporter [Tepidibacter aestuarii]|uniref:DMT family transporter n=1 Tax=Tepidibacter aestuarii TaxID=2925782 RepID=UPI0020BEB598|nr:DMT family transporter [Tepidibacter aestuarii]CAH2212235.1 Drug/metabolite transporter (DMT)-like permease [Tepidibacter aestuarii]